MEFFRNLWYFFFGFGSDEKENEKLAGFEKKLNSMVEEDELTKFLELKHFYNENGLKGFTIENFGLNRLDYLEIFFKYNREQNLDFSGVDIDSLKKIQKILKRNPKYVF